MTEAQIAMLQAKKRKEQEDELKAMDADSRRKQELKNIEEELVVLKQRQEERRREREVEEVEILKVFFINFIMCFSAKRLNVVESRMRNARLKRYYFDLNFVNFKF